MLECDVERVEGIEPLLDRDDWKACRCVGAEYMRGHTSLGIKLF